MRFPSVKISIFAFKVSICHKMMNILNNSYSIHVFYSNCSPNTVHNNFIFPSANKHLSCNISFQSILII